MCLNSTHGQVSESKCHPRLSSRFSVDQTQNQESTSKIWRRISEILHSLIPIT